MRRCGKGWSGRGAGACALTGLYCGDRLPAVLYQRLIPRRLLGVAEAGKERRVSQRDECLRLVQGHELTVGDDMAAAGSFIADDLPLLGHDDLQSSSIRASFSLATIRAWSGT